MTLTKLPSVADLIDNCLIAPPKVNAYSQAACLTQWWHRVRHWEPGNFPGNFKGAANRFVADYFPNLPALPDIENNNLHAPQAPLLYLKGVTLNKEIRAAASRKIVVPEDGEAWPEPFFLPSADKTYSLAGHLEPCSGELVFSSSAFTLPGPIPFQWKLCYRSAGGEDFGFGPGWYHPLCERLWLRPGRLAGESTLIHYLRSDGRYVQFAQPSIGEACVNRSEGLVLQREGGMTYRLIEADAPDKIFRSDGANPWFPLVEIRDSIDNVLSIDYHDGLPTKLVSSWGRVLEFSHHQGRILKIQPAVREADAVPLATYEYGDGLIVRIHSSQAALESFAYENGRLLHRSLPCGGQLYFDWSETEQRYDGLKDAELHYRVKWRNTQRCADISNNLGHTSRAVFDKEHRLVEFCDAQGHVERRFYDLYGNLCSLTNALGQTAYYRWDNLGRCVRQTDVSGLSTYFKYDELGCPVCVENSAGQRWLRRFNEFAQLVSEQDPLGNSWLFSYNQKQYLHYMEDPEGGKTHFQWNSLAELERVTSQEGQVTALKYDPSGRLEKVLRSDQSLVHYQYDGQNRLELVQIYALEKWRFRYDERGRIKALGVPGGFALACDYDEYGRCKHIKSKQGDTLQYSYDAMGNCAELQGDAVSYVCEYNCLGWLVSLQDSAGREQKFTYDAVGRLQQHRDMAIITKIERNAAGLPVKIENNSGESREYHYDELSRLVLAASNRWSTTRFQYDLCNKPIAEHQENEGSGSTSFYYHYDKRGWREKMSNETQVLANLHTPDGYLRGLDLNGDAVLRCDQDSFGREDHWVQGEVKTQFIWQQSALQALKSLVGKAQDVVFDESFPAEATSFLLQAIGFTRLSATSGSGQCDDRGNLILEDGNRFNFNGWNQLVSAENEDFKTRYRYDAFGRRIEKKSTHRKSKNFRRSTYISRGKHLWGEKHSGEKDGDYSYYLRHPKTGALVAMIKGEQQYYYLNTPSLQPLRVFEKNGGSYWHARYDEAGKYLGQQSQPRLSSPWRGKEYYYDGSETKLYFDGEDYYSLRSQRYLSSK